MATEQSTQLFSTQTSVFAAAQTEAQLQDETVAPAFAATYTPDMTGKKTLTVAFPLTANTTIAAPTGARRGQRLTFIFAATGVFTVTWNAAFKAAANGAAANGQAGSTTFFYNGTNWVQDAGALTYK